LTHLGRRIPVRPGLLAADLFRACPAEAVAADADGVRVGAIVGEHVVELARAGIDHNGVGGEIVWKRNHRGSHRGDRRTRSPLADLVRPDTALSLGSLLPAGLVVV